MSLRIYETQRHIGAQVRVVHRHLKRRDLIWVGMVGDGWIG